MFGEVKMFKNYIGGEGRGELWCVEECLKNIASATWGYAGLKQWNLGL